MHPTFFRTHHALHHSAQAAAKRPHTSEAPSDRRRASATRGCFLARPGHAVPQLVRVRAEVLVRVAEVHDHDLRAPSARV
eukprot:14309267-Heterocapsa_arctica.AAC.1